ncbi:SH3 domain-containing protein [Aquisalibacillus elongatus]|uniref:SH3 domain-containing protein n=1 Tax=Aquisalibacillus elongatus TaxID=485577 RepID=UPI000F5350F2|nr:SH3 domain-containing protein [Aquisalibacillus elongatus]
MIIVSAFLIATLMAISTVYADNNYEGVALKDKTHVYQDSSRDSKQLKSYSQGSILKYRDYNSNWYEATVILNNKAHTGYIHKNDVENADLNTEKLEGVALEGNTHVFSSASTGSDPLKSYGKGTILKYESFTSNWYKATVYLNNKAHTGYIHKNHVETATSEPSDEEGVALKNPTSVFAEANTGSKKLKSYNSGNILKFETYTSDWYKATVILNHEPHTGYIHKNHVDRLIKNPTGLKGVAQEYTTIYSNPSENSKSLKSYSAGSILQYETYSSNWYKATVILNHEPHTGYLPANKVDNLVDKQEDLRGIAINGKTSTYERPSKDSSKVKTYNEGSVLIYKSLSRNWHEAVNIVNGKKKKVYIPRNQVENAFKEQESLQGIAVKEPTKAYSQASRESKVWKDYGKNSPLKLKTFSENWYEATVIVNSKPRKAYFHHNDVSNDVSYDKTHYGTDFDRAVEIQYDLGGHKDGAGRYRASRSDIAKYLNSNNYEKGTREYLQFLVLSYPLGISGNELNEKMLSSKGTLTGTGNAFAQGANDYQVNEVYLIGHALHETGNGTSNLAQGVEVGKNTNNQLRIVTDSNRDKLNDIKTTFNMYGIHAFNSCPTECGAKKAYKEGWFTPEKAIIGGAKFIREEWIDRGQDTLYKMKWNPDNPGSHQYATHIKWAELQTYYYDLFDFDVQIYDIPVYKNQPQENEYLSSTYPKNVTGITNVKLSLRKGPSTSYSRETVLDKDTELELLGKSGNWYQVKVKDSSLEGWVARDEGEELYATALNLLQADVALNVRKNATTSASKVGLLEGGQFIAAVLDDNSNLISKTADGYKWYKIYYNGDTAWIAGHEIDGEDYVNIIE